MTGECQGLRLVDAVSWIGLVSLAALAMMLLGEMQSGTEPEVEGAHCAGTWRVGRRMPHKF